MSSAENEGTTLDSRDDERAATSSSLWCYLVELRGQPYAVPDEVDAVLLPLISRLPPIAATPRRLLPPYILGLVGVHGSTDVVVDLGAVLGLPAATAESKQRRLIVIGESSTVPVHAAHAPYRLSFAVDDGFGLIAIDSSALNLDSSASSHLDRGTVVTALGLTTVLMMRNVCARIMADLGSERSWGSYDLEQNHVAHRVAG